MKKLFLLFVLALAPLSLFAQNVRISIPFPSISSQYPPLLQANIAPNLPVLAVCNYPANATPCTNYATTYDSTGAACSNGAQDTPDPQPSSCQSTGDAQGNLGFWIPPGTYDYTVCIQNTVSCFGPYTFTAGSGGISGIELQTNGVDNGNQHKQNLKQGSGITVTDDGSGGITIASSASGGLQLFTSTGSQPPQKIQEGDATIGGGGTVTVTINASVYDSSWEYAAVALPATGASGGVTVQATASNTITFSGTPGDGFFYIIFPLAPLS